MKPSSMTIADAVEFVVLHRRKGRRPVFVDFTRDQIALAIQEAIAVNGFAFATTPAGNRIAGIVLAKPDHERKTLHVRHMLGTVGSLKALIRSYREMYDGYTITARRKGQPVVYHRTDRLAELAERL